MRTHRPLALAALVLPALLLTASAARADVYTDPTGDTFGPGPFRPDITTYSAVASPGPQLITFEVDFAGPVSPPHLFMPATSPAPSVVGYIDIDTDKDPATGGPSHINTVVGVPGPPIALGADYFIDLFSERLHPGLVDVANGTTGAVVGLVPIAYGPTSLSVAVPFALINDPSGAGNFDVLVGNFSGATDRAPNGAGPNAIQVIPEPGALALLAVGLAGVASCRRRWRAA
jgi:hypothetical protein